VFIPVVSAIGILLVGSVAFGIARWQQPFGKIAAVLGGLLFIVLAGFTVIVLFLDWSARHGAPM
jgi:hypothetical protein